MQDLTILTLIASALSSYAIFAAATRRKGKHLPPGPPGWPIIGNLLDMPSERSWIKFNEWAKRYGEAVTTSVFGQKVVILNSRKAVDSILQKKSGTSSDRPPFPVAGDWGGFGWALFTLSYTEEFKLQRRMLTQVMGPKTHEEFNTIVRSKVLRYCQSLSKSPEEFMYHTKYLVGSSLTRIIYGHKALDLDDSYIQGSEKLLHAVGELPPLGQHPVDLFPSLSVLPVRLFGSRFKAGVDGLRRYAKAFLEEPYAETKETITSGAALKPSMVHTLVEKNTSKDGNVKSEDSIKAISAMTYTAGVDATISSIETFLLYISFNPEVQKKAQATVDEVTGGLRLPTYDDRANMPYIEALVMEVLRLGCNVPLALPHRMAADEIYDGMTIPAGTVVIPNSKGVSREESAYPNPDSLIPERYLEANGVTFKVDVPDPRVPTFGYGRRVCPGRHLAETMLWKTIVTILSCFDVLVGLDEQSNPITPDLEYDSTLIVSHPPPFKCRIVPRSAEAIDLLNATAEEGCIDDA